VTAVWTIIALIVPWAAGIALVTVLGDRRGGKVLALGAGWLAGQAMMMAALYVSLMTSGSGHARIVLGILALAAVILLVHLAYSPRGGAVSGALSERPGQILASRWFWLIQRVMLGIIVASLLAKVYLLICSHAFVPIRNDDAISIWLFKAKVIASLDQLPQDPASPYYLGGSNPRYSVFVPLAAAWIPMVTGQWHEQLATLPWLFYYVNMLLLVGGGLRRWLTSTQSWIAAYVVASLPLMVVHAYRPGYADLILAGFLAAAVLYLLIWRETNLVRHLAIAVMFAMIAASLKRESPALVAIAVLAVLIPSWRNILAWSIRTCIAAAVVGGMAVLAVGLVVDFSEQKEAARLLEYHPAVWGKLAQHLFEWSSFHFSFGGWSPSPRQCPAYATFRLGCLLYC
jgi:hypothetical protein